MTSLRNVLALAVLAGLFSTVGCKHEEAAAPTTTESGSAPVAASPATTASE